MKSTVISLSGAAGFVVILLTLVTGDKNSLGPFAGLSILVAIQADVKEACVYSRVCTIRKTQNWR